MNRKCSILPNLRSAALLALALGTGSVLAVDGVWVTNATGGNWDDASKWVGGVPGGVGATADFQVARSSGNINVALNGDRTIGILKLGFFGDGRGLNLTASGNLILDNGGSDAVINFRDGGGNVGIQVATQLNSNLLINNLDNGGNKGFFFTGGLSSTNGHLTITNTSDAASRTKFNSVISDGTAGNSITYSQTAGWSEFTSANTFTGTTTNGGGLLHLGNTGGISLALQNSALNTTGSIAGTATVGLRLYAGITSLTLGGLIGDKNFAATGGVFSTASSNYDLVTALTLNPGTGKSHSYSGVIANGAADMTVTKTGDGTQTLTNANTYTGATNVNGGKLFIDGSIYGGSLTTVNSTATLGGTGTVGALTIATGGTLAPGSDNIESLGAAIVAFGAGSTFAYELNSASLNGDLLDSTGTLDITAGAILTLSDVVSGSLGSGKLTLISYMGGWTSSELFTYMGNTLNDGDLITVGSNQWQFDYNDSIGGSNFSGEQAGATHFVTMTVVPEPGSALMLVGGLTTLLGFRRRRA